MRVRTHRSVALKTVGNWQGSTMCFDLDTEKFVTCRIVKEVPYPDRVIKSVNEWGKTTSGQTYSDGSEFRNRKRHLFDWANEELSEELPEGEEPIYPGILTESLRLVLETDLTYDVDAVMTLLPPILAKQAATTLSSARITPDSDIVQGIIGVHRDTTGVDTNSFLSITPRPTQIQPVVELLYFPTPIHRQTSQET